MDDHCDQADWADQYHGDLGSGLTRVARMSDKDGRPGWCVARFNCCESLQLLHQAEAEGRAGVRFHLYSANVLLRRSINCS